MVMTRLRWMRRCVAPAAAALMLGACEIGAEPDAPFPTRTPLASPTGVGNDVIVLIGTSSGDNSWRGDGAFRGADLGVSYLNRTRQEGDSVIELVTLDDGGDPDEAKRLIEEHAGRDATIGIVYAGPSHALAESESALAAAGIPGMLCFGDLHGAGALTDHVFQLSPSYLWEARRIARYLFRDRRYRKVGALVRAAPSGRVARRGLRRSFARFGARRPVVEAYSGAGEIDDALRRLRAQRVEAIVVEGSPSQSVETLERLGRMDATYRGTPSARIASARNARIARANARDWRPQLLGFDGLATQVPQDLVVPGTVAADSYARGVHYLPIPSFESFRDAYVDWWGELPLNWEQRSYSAVRMIGWAARNTADDEDPVETLETLQGERFGGLDVSFGPRDHTAIDPSSIGLWVVPRRGAAPEAGRVPEGLPWVPLGRGFSSNGRRTDIAPQDWRFLFRGKLPPRSRPPEVGRARFGVATGRRDPIH